MDAKSDSIGTPSRAPQQGRSRASFERMMEAAEELLRERGTDEFTLAEVSKRGKASIGSIYCRFDSKDDLIRAVQERVLDKLQAQQLSAIEAASAAGDIPSLVPQLIEAVAETLREYAPIMRPLMLRSVVDPEVAAAGRNSYLRVAEAVEQAVLAHRVSITHPDPDRAAGAMFRIAYAAIARFLGFGSPGPQREDLLLWRELKQDLALMCTAFLMVRPECEKSWADAQRG